MSAGSGGFGSPCGACKFLRRKCAQGCVFAPYFCHEQGAEHFAAIHKVFGASNASKLLAHLPSNDRPEAAFTISYEAQARLQDPIYGCVAQIFALQLQVVNLQTQLASLKAQTAQGFLLNPTTSMARNNNNCSYIQSNIMNDNYPQLIFEEGSSCAMASLDGLVNTDMEDLRSLAYGYFHRHT